MATSPPLTSPSAPNGKRKTKAKVMPGKLDEIRFIDMDNRGPFSPSIVHSLLIDYGHLCIDGQIDLQSVRTELLEDQHSFTSLSRSPGIGERAMHKILEHLGLLEEYERREEKRRQRKPPKEVPTRDLSESEIEKLKKASALAQTAFEALEMAQEEFARQKRKFADDYGPIIEEMVGSGAKINDITKSLPGDSWRELKPYFDVGKEKRKTKANA